MVGSLFEEPGAFDRAGLATRLNALAGERIYIGGSSWKYPGWLGQVYSGERYLWRGRFAAIRAFAVSPIRRFASSARRRLNQHNEIDRLRERERP